MLQMIPPLAGLGNLKVGAQRAGAQSTYKDCGRLARTVLRPHLDA